MLLGALHDAVEALNQLDVDRLDDADLDRMVLGLRAEVSRLAAAEARVLARWDARQVWAADGSKAAGAHLARETDMTKGHANAVLKRSRRLAAMPVVAKAFARGSLSADLVDLLVRVNLPRRADLFARDEAMLVEACIAQECERDVRQVLDRWALEADTALGFDPAERERDGRKLNVARSFEGTWDLQGRFDRVEGTIVADELARLEHELFEQDWAEARAEHGADCSADKLPRTAAQRRADALVEMAKRSAVANGRSPARPLVSVVVGYDRFRAMMLELSDGTPLSRDQLLPLLAEGDIERIVFGLGSRILDISTQRLFTGALRHAIEVRDRHCQHPGCDVPAEQCQIDHIVPWTQGGRTTDVNGRAYCATHNRRRNNDPHDLDNPIVMRRIMDRRLAELVSTHPPP